MRIAALVVAATLTLLGRTASAQSVTYDFDKAADFSRLKTYAWAGGNLNDDLNHRRIVAAIDAQLASKGFSKVESGANPDVLVGYRAGVDRDLQINGYRYGLARNGTARVEQRYVGTLVVDLVDAKAGTVVWRGIARRDIDVDASPETRDKNINRAVEKLFKHYPPGM